MKAAPHRAGQLDKKCRHQDFHYPGDPHNAVFSGDGLCGGFRGREKKGGDQEKPAGCFPDLHTPIIPAGIRHTYWEYHG